MGKTDLNGATSRSFLQSIQELTTQTARPFLQYWRDIGGAQSQIIKPVQVVYSDRLVSFFCPRLPIGQKRKEGGQRIKAVSAIAQLPSLSVPASRLGLGLTLSHESNSLEGG